MRRRSAVFPLFAEAWLVFVTSQLQFITRGGKKQANRVADERKWRRKNMADQKMIFVNLPVDDLHRSKTFYESLGFRNEPKFTNEAAAMMVLSDTISVMLLTKPFYA